MVVPPIVFDDFNVLGVALGTVNFGSQKPFIDTILVEVEIFDMSIKVVLMPTPICCGTKVLLNRLKINFGIRVQRNVSYLNSADPTRTMLEPHAIANS